MNSPTRRLRGLVAALLITAVGCSSETDSDGSTTTVTRSTASSTEPPSTAPSTEPPSTTTASCDAESILPVVASLFPDNDAWVIIDVDVANCQNGYARVFAFPDQSGCPDGDPCLENEQVFLVEVDGSWEYLDSGTGLQCPDAPISEACEALGLP